ncbi:MAG: hypothetical protein RL149_870 [Actinomycetota bacterium]
MVEFLLVLLPMIAIASATLGLSWFAFERVALRVLSIEAAWRLSQPDFEQADLHDYLAGEMLRQTGMNRFSLIGEKGGGIASVSILVDEFALPGGLGISAPELKLSSHAPVEN